MLSLKLLEELRAHWRRLRRKPSVWLFPGNRWHSGGQPLDTKTPRNACKQAAQRAGLKKKVYPHILRHYSGFWTMPGALSKTSTNPSKIARSIRVPWSAYPA